MHGRRCRGGAGLRVALVAAEDSRATGPGLTRVVVENDVDVVVDRLIVRRGGVRNRSQLGIARVRDVGGACPLGGCLTRPGWVVTGAVGTLGRWVGVERRAAGRVRSVSEWAQVRTLAADGISQREIAGRLGMNRRTVRRLIEAPEPPRYRREATGSILDPFEREVGRTAQGLRRAQVRPAGQ